MFAPEQYDWRDHSNDGGWEILLYEPGWQNQETGGSIRETGGYLYRGKSVSDRCSVRINLLFHPLDIF